MTGWEPTHLLTDDGGGELWIGGTSPNDDLLTWDYRDQVNRWTGLDRDWVGPAVSLEHFDAVVTMYRGAAPVDRGVAEHRFGISDGPLEDGQLPGIHAAADWAAERLESGDRVLVRCQMGWNRSGLVAALVLREWGFSGAEAVDWIRSARSPMCLSNPEYRVYLEDLGVPEAEAGAA